MAMIIQYKAYVKVSFVARADSLHLDEPYRFPSDFFFFLPRELPSAAVPATPYVPLLGFWRCDPILPRAKRKHVVHGWQTELGAVSIVTAWFSGSNVTGALTSFID